MTTALKTLLTFLTLSATLLFYGCNQLNPILGSENTTETTFDFKDFNTLEINNSFDVEIIQSSEYKTIVTCNDNFREHLDVDHNGETLKIGLINGYNYNNAQLSAKVYTPDITKIKANGASSIHIPQLSTDNLTVKLSGASNLDGIINLTSNLEIDASGASDIDISGYAQNANLSFSGASTLKGKNMVIDHMLDIDGSGASNISITVNGTINASLSGASQVAYYGDGSVTEQKTSGASSIDKR